MKNLPNSSGVYYFYEGDRLLYVGKAKNLKSRTTEHAVNNLMDREGKYLQKMHKLKGFDYEKENWPEDFKKAFKDFELRYLFHTQTPIVIDMIFHRVTRIEIEEMPHELTRDRETALINELQPPFNSESGSDEYYAIRHE